MSEMVKATINGKSIEVPQGTTILDAAKTMSIDIPTLCHLNLHDFGIVNKVASCRVCVVEVENRPALMPSCATEITEGMNVKTHTARAVQGRRTALELLLSDHPQDCLSCAKNQNCDLQSLAGEMGILDIRYEGESLEYEKDISSASLVRDPNKCIMCRRCETMCNEVQTCGILSGVNRGFDSFVGTAFNLPLNETSCTYCGQCLAVCPTAAISEKNNISEVWNSLLDPTKHVVVQVAPAIRVAIGEEFGMEPGTLVTGQLAAGLRTMGFDGVFDTDFAADLTIMEEASELVHRIQSGGPLPMLTSCCPAWVRFIEANYPDLLDIPSTCRSPQIMFGAIAKTYYAKKKNIKPENMTVISVMPCVAKKTEAERPELVSAGESDVDFVLTTRELAQMFKIAGINFTELPEEDFDDVLGASTGAAVIFGATGGVIEAATRTAYEWITGEELEKVDFQQLRGMEGIRSASVDIGDLTLNIGIAHGLGNARKLLDDIRAGKSNFHAIEIMACPGGCIGGGGQPYHHGDSEIIKKRAEAIYREDAGKKIRSSHKNPQIVALYDEYLGKPYGEKAHKLLHTTYKKRDKI